MGSMLTLSLIAALALEVLPANSDRAARAGSASAWQALAAVVLTLTAASITVALQWLRHKRCMRRISTAVRGVLGGDAAASAGAPNDPLEAIEQLRLRTEEQVRTIDLQRRTLESLLTQLREGVLVANARGHIALINPAAIQALKLEFSPRPEAYIGVAVERCIPQRDVQRLLLTPAAAIGPPLDDPAGGAAAPGERTQAPLAAESRIRVESDAGPVHLIAHASDVLLPGPMASERGLTRGRAVVLTDITALDRTIQMRTDFVANASHELRTPLSTIRAAVETLQSLDFRADGQEALRFIDIVDRQSARLEALAKDLLELSRLESGAWNDLRRKPLDAGHLLDELHREFEKRIEAKGLHWSTDLGPAQAPEILVNEQLLRLVLDNLVDNAIKYTDRGGRVRVGVYRRPERVLIEVSDTGCGIPLAEQKRVFERFYQVDRGRSGAERGTGLGLAIVRHALHVMGGTLRLESAPGKGTRITVELPQKASPAPATLAAAPGP